MSVSHNLFVPAETLDDKMRIVKAVIKALDVFQKKRLDQALEKLGGNRLTATQINEGQEWSLGVQKVLYSSDHDCYRAFFTIGGEKRMAHIHLDCACDFRNHFVKGVGAKTPLKEQALQYHDGVIIGLNAWGMHKEIMNAVATHLLDGVSSDVWGLEADDDSCCYKPCNQQQAN